MEHAAEQNRLFFLNLARRSTVPQASHLASSPLADIPTTFDGDPACFFPTKKIRKYQTECKKKKTYVVAHLIPYRWKIEQVYNLLTNQDELEMARMILG